MGLHDEFRAAVKAIEVIDFSTCALEEINVFETTIRYLGGFLAAYDLSGGQYPALLQKAGEIGDMLYVAFDTPNRMPITRWNFKAAAAGSSQESSENMLVAEIGSLTLEFTRLSQLTGDPRYFDAVQRIMDLFDEQQSRTKLPGMWSVVVNAKTEDFMGGTGFTIGGMADSLYEYLPKVSHTNPLKGPMLT
jgi:mannosyl-oligosaccharide alpha-1,2-mannosidase